MNKNRLEAFSDGVLAIIITIMVLELTPPQGTHLDALTPLFHTVLSYILSFMYVGIYWNNHHHMLHTVRQVNGRILWANLHLLFWLSLFPFATAWMGENHFAPTPVALYGGVLFMAGLSYYILSRSLIKLHGKDSTLAKAVGKDVKGLFSQALYALAIPLSFVEPWVAFAIYLSVAFMWIVPDQRIEKVLNG
ncbi:TMEM175 family protein [bacterium]|nr:TMEM175 family protein [bacterium]